MPVEDIVDSVYGLLVRDVDEHQMATAKGAPSVSGGTISGLLLTGPGEIWVSAKEAELWPPRRRFTIGHELGHWVLHNTNDERLFCRTVEVEAEPASESPLLPNPDGQLEQPRVPLIETEANVFAACLLMPSYLVQSEYERCDGQLDRMTSCFKSSEKAMKRRIKHVVPRDRRRRRPA